jgi:hypothetical protein
MDNGYDDGDENGHDVENDHDEDIAAVDLPDDSLDEGIMIPVPNQAEDGLIVEPEIQLLQEAEASQSFKQKDQQCVASPRKDI